jgi:hypothetical protein
MTKVLNGLELNILHLQENTIDGTLRIKLAQEEAFVVHDSSCRIRKTGYSYVIKKASTVLAKLGRSSYWEWYQESLKHSLITED